MKKRIVLVVTALTLVALLVGATGVMAAKPPHAGEGNQFIPRPNGFPAGQHFNLNIHGKDPETFVCDATPGGKSLFVALYGASTIQYVSNKKASVYDLTVLDPCAMPESYGGDGVAKVQLPYQVLVDDVPTPAGGYYVYARILAKPNNGNDANTEPRSNIILYPNTVAEACNDPGNPEFGNYTECPEDPELMLGLIVGENLYVPDPENEQLYRFEDPSAKGRGKSTAVNITRLFIYTGWVVDATLDVNEDGIIDINDVPVADYGENMPGENRDYNNDGVEDEADVEAWLTDMAALAEPKAWYFANEWIFNIADLVITEQGLMNDGTRLVQIRFYPVVTTTFSG